MIPPLPDGAVLLHIGPQKTGSTAIQMAMHESRSRLADHGVLYPGHQMRPREAGWAVMGIDSAVGRRAPRPERWDELVAELGASSLPRTCLSNEDFARSDDGAIDRILEGTGADRTHLLYVARRLDKVLPSHWQERVKARVTWSYDEFLHQVISGDGSAYERGLMWEPHDVGAVIDRWARRIPRDRITVIVSDDSDRDLIPRTFEQLLDLPAQSLVPPPGLSNTSLTYTEVEVVRRLNRTSREHGWTPRQYWRIVQAGVVRSLRDAPTEDRLRITGLPAWAFDDVARRCDEQADAVLAAGVRVVGDPDGLRIRDRLTPVELPEPIEAVALDVVAQAVRGAVAGVESPHMASEHRAAAGGPAPRGPGDLSGRELISSLAGRFRRGGGAG